MKECSKCGDTDAVFYKSSGRRCIPCVRANQKAHKLANGPAISAARKRDRSLPIGKARDLLAHMDAVSRKEGMPTPEFTLEEITFACQGWCDQTGIKFELENTSQGKRNPFGPSPDRKDPAIGYTKANVQWVCWMFNLMKCDYEPAVVNKFISALQYE